MFDLHVVRAVLEAEQIPRCLPGRRSSTTCGRSRAATTAPRRCRTRCGPGCGSRGRRPADRPNTPGRRGRRRTRAGRGCRPRSGGAVAARPGGEPARPKRSLPSASSNSPGPKPKVIVSRAGGSPYASPVSCGGATIGPSIAPNSPTSWPFVICAAAAVQRGEQRDDVVARLRGEVEGGEMQTVLHRRDDAGLVRPVEVDDVVARLRPARSSEVTRIRRAIRRVTSVATPAVLAPATVRKRRRESVTERRLR